MTSSDQNDETESLLSQEEQSPVSHRHSFTRHFPLLSPAAFKAFWNQEAQLILLCAFLLQFLISFAKHVIEVPTIRLFELAACREYYRRLHGPTVSVNDPGGCKVPQVQDELSILTGYKFGFDAVYALIQSCLTSLPKTKNCPLVQVYCWPFIMAQWLASTGVNVCCSCSAPACYLIWLG